MDFSDSPDRQYSKIWRELKQNKIARVAAPRALHRRIIKAVKKEKYMDFSYKLELSELMGGKKAVISHDRSGGVLSFYLRFSLTEFDF